MARVYCEVHTSEQIKKLEERNGENIYVKCVIPKSLNTHQLMRPKSFERRRMCWTITTSTNIHISFGSMSVCVAVSLSHLFILKLLRVRISFFVFPFPFPHFFPFPLQLASFSAKTQNAGNGRVDK